MEYVVAKILESGVRVLRTLQVVFKVFNEYGTPFFCVGTSQMLEGIHYQFVMRVPAFIGADHIIELGI